MARQVVVTLIDDLDETSTADETVTFGLDGVEYEVDLSETHALELRDDLEKWVAVARRSGGKKHAPRVVTAQGGKKSNRRDPAQLAEIRRWARDHGHKVSDRGRIPDTIMDAYQDAHASV